MRLVNNAETQPEAAASVVLTAARDAIFPLPSLVTVVMDPALKPYQPNQRMKAPRTYF